MILSALQTGFTAGGLWLAATVPGCPVPPMPDVDVYAVTADTKIDETLSIAQLSGFNVDTDDIYSAVDSHHADKGGVMHGRIGMAYGIELDKMRARVRDKNCLHFKRITVTLTLEPTIYIAREYLRGSCMYDAILSHEREHVAIDRAGIEKYAARVRDGMRIALASQGDVQSPPIVPEDTAMMKARMQQGVITIAEAVLRDMHAERAQMQQALDSPGSYAAMLGQCPDYDYEAQRRD